MKNKHDKGPKYSKPGQSNETIARGVNRRGRGQTGPLGQTAFGRQFGKINQQTGEIRKKWDENRENRVEKENIGKLASADGGLATPLPIALFSHRYENRSNPLLCYALLAWLEHWVK